MNIFVTNECPIQSAKDLCDKHVVKMVTESAQMLSTAHRVLDGTMEIRPSKSGLRMVPYYKLDDERENILMRAVHIKHPCTIWSMKSTSNYLWHYRHYKALAEEYTYRYGKEHGAWYSKNIGETLSSFPHNMVENEFTPWAVAMKHFPECIVENDVIQSYRNYYNVAKKDFAKWTKRPVPEFMR